MHFTRAQRASKGHTLVWISSEVDACTCYYCTRTRCRHPREALRCGTQPPLPLLVAGPAAGSALLATLLAELVFCCAVGMPWQRSVGHRTRLPALKISCTCVVMGTTFVHMPELCVRLRYLAARAWKRPSQVLDYFPVGTQQSPPDGNGGLSSPSQT